MHCLKSASVRFACATIRLLCCVFALPRIGGYHPLKKYFMFSVTSACARRTGVASQAFERMHSTLSHRSKTLVPHGTIAVLHLCASPYFTAGTQPCEDVNRLNNTALRCTVEPSVVGRFVVAVTLGGSSSSPNNTNNMNILDKMCPAGFTGFPGEICFSCPSVRHPHCCCQPFQTFTEALLSNMNIIDSFLLSWCCSLHAPL